MASTLKPRRRTPCYLPSFKNSLAQLAIRFKLTLDEDLVFGINIALAANSTQAAYSLGPMIHSSTLESDLVQCKQCWLQNETMIGG